jgi:hypothetical protein
MTITSEKVQHLVDLANGLGAQGIWLVRGGLDAQMRFTWPDVEPQKQSGQGLTITSGFGFTFGIADADLIIVMRFPVGDGGPKGVESR